MWTDFDPVYGGEGPIAPSLHCTNNLSWQCEAMYSSQCTSNLRRAVECRGGSNDGVQRTIDTRAALSSSLER
jgi:hypothetical protein